MRRTWSRWATARDRETGLPVYSLYGETRVPTPAMLAGVDAMVYDVQDVGSRYYTFVYTMLHVMQACAREKKRVVVLDRPNPLGGDGVDGNLLDPAFRSFVGMHPLVVRHGMTSGELALLFKQELALDVDLHVVPMKGWRRPMHYEDTGLPWVLPSPNIPTVDTAFVYPGGCLVEGTNLSEGRGTTRPFELVGAPWLDGHALARALEAERLAGRRLPRRGVHAHVPEAPGRALPRRAGPRHGPRALPRLPDVPAADPPRAAPGREALRLARPAVRVRARQAPDRHPVRHRPGAQDDRAGRLAEAARGRLPQGRGRPSAGDGGSTCSTDGSRGAFEPVPVPALPATRVGGAARRHAAHARRARPRPDPRTRRAHLAERGRGGLPPALAPAQPLRRRGAGPLPRHQHLPRPRRAARCRS